MAKNRRRGRASGPRPQASEASARPAPNEDLAARLASLRNEVEAAKASAEDRVVRNGHGNGNGHDEEHAEEPAAAAVEAGTPAPTESIPVATEVVSAGAPPSPPELQPPYQRPAPPGGARRGRSADLVGAGVICLVIVGVIIAVLASKSGAKTPSASSNPVKAYLASHVAAGTRVAVLGNPSDKLPSGYQAVATASPQSLAGVRYALAPDPVSALGPQASSYIQSHGTIVADDGKSALWALAVSTPPVTTGPVVPPTTPKTTLPPVTTPPVTTPATTVAPATTAPPATVAPPVTTPPTSPPSTAPPTTTPPTTAAPAPTNPPTSTGPPAGSGQALPSSVVVQHGQSFWSLAQQLLTQKLGSTPTQAQVGHYWASLVAANANHLVSGNPNLIYSGQVLVVPNG